MSINVSEEGHALEEEFFRKESDRLTESLREMKALEQTTGLLSEVSGINDIQLLEKLDQLKVTPACAAALVIVPLMEVAWADGNVAVAEREAILDSLDQLLFFQTIDRDIVEEGLTQAPSRQLFALWEAYARRLTEQLELKQKKALAASILGHAQEVAKAAGTFLGFGGISKAEQGVIDCLVKILR